MPTSRLHPARRPASRLALPLLALLAAGCRISTVREVDVYSTRAPEDAEPVIAAFVRASGLPVRPAYASEALEEGARASDGTARPDVTWSDDPVHLLGVGSREGDAATAATWRVVGERTQVLYVRTASMDGRPVPTSIRDLARPEWSGRVAMTDPRSGATAVHVGALSQAWGDVEVRALLERLRANDVRIVDSERGVRDLVASGDVAVGLGSYDPLDGPLPRGVIAVVPDSAEVGALVVPTVAVLDPAGRNPEGGLRFLQFLADARTRRAARGEASPVTVGSAHRSTVAIGDAARASQRLRPWLDGWARGTPTNAGAVLLGARD